MKKFTIVIPFLFSLFGCHNQPTPERPILSSIQLLDKNGITETISAKERLSKYDSIDFGSPQPYHQVLRIYSQHVNGKTKSRLSSYHNNGYLHQNLDIADGRANGAYRKWHENGKLYIEATVIEGAPSFSKSDQESWVFDGISKSYDKSGSLACEISYEKGALHGNATYYYSNGTVQKEVLYVNNEIDGITHSYNLDNTIASEESFQNGKKHGITKMYGKNKQLSSWEEFNDNLLISAKYYDLSHNLIASVEGGFGITAIFDKESRLLEMREIKDGIQEGLIREYDDKGKLLHCYSLIENQKSGEEVFYSKSSDSIILSISWKNGMIHGVVRSWHDNGSIETQKEYSQNQKQGLSFAWFPNGQVMLHEEYEKDSLRKGNYYHMNEETPVSSVIQGNGIATLYDRDGIFISKVHYRNGSPEEE